MSTFSPSLPATVHFRQHLSTTTVYQCFLKFIRLTLAHTVTSFLALQGSLPNTNFDFRIVRSQDWCQKSLKLKIKKNSQKFRGFSLSLRGSAMIQRLIQWTSLTRSRPKFLQISAIPPFLFQISAGHFQAGFTPRFGFNFTIKYIFYYIGVYII